MEITAVLMGHIICSMDYRHSYQSKGEELHAQGDLKVLTQRWHQLWIQSLSLQCNIEREQRQLDQSEDATESDPELREPLIKKRKTVEKTHQSDDSLRSEEDVIPFYDDEYERFASESMENVPVSSELNISKIEPSDERFCAEPQPDIGYSSGDNSNQCSARNTSSGQTPPQVSLEGRIEASPAKGFYKTVALDDFGVTDTETPRICANTWPSSLSDPPVLSDSLIVNVDDVQDSVSQHDFEVGKEIRYHCTY
ncbi:hypothetical protein AB6A40_004375 [Gnathostoma spinigerum]|uniref:Uncharacterized protein n=1 Tax=Gnathostoma spinigerum TaxID=75299 RepID=A0ABD6EJS0_9BILA